MRSISRMCFNWKVVGGPGLVAMGVLFIAPAIAPAVLPLLIVAVGPLMMRDGGSHEPNVAGPRGRGADPAVPAVVEVRS